VGQARSGFLSNGLIFLFVTLLFAVAAHAQFGPPEPDYPGPRFPTPTVFPAPGTYPTTESVTLLDADPAAEIHYTLDGSQPTSKSPLYDPLRVLFIGGVYDGERGLKTGYTIRAIATKEGHAHSEVATFLFTVDRRDRASYVSEEILPGVRMIRDSDNDKMFLVHGTKACALIDTGMGHGKLREYVEQFTGGLPIKVIFTHSHMDHIGQGNEFIAASEEFIGAPDREATVAFFAHQGVPADQIQDHLKSVSDGDHVDIGDRSLLIFAAPGHTPGSLVVLDPLTGNTFSGDSFGSNSPTIPDALWMQFSKTPLDVYLATVKGVRLNLGDRVKALMTGHNDHPLTSQEYLDNLERALQDLMDKGDAALVPSYRPAGLEQVVVGNRLTDPNWASINVNKEHYLPATIGEISSLSAIGLKGAKLSTLLMPDNLKPEARLEAGVHEVTITPFPTSSRVSRMTVNGIPVSVGSSSKVRVTSAMSPVAIVVTSPDGQKTTTYTLTLRRE
jgi:glyoxylase-like metal-dependent hydrolase (beta-lactamase superfamily II)